VHTLNLRELSRRFGLVLSFIVLCVVLSLLSDRFLTPSNAINVLRQSTINGIIAIGMTYVILIAGIDLSVGAVLALSTVVTAGWGLSTDSSSPKGACLLLWLHWV